MGFKELIALLAAGKAEDPSSVYDDLQSEYDTAVSRSEESEERIKNLMSEISDLKAKNYDLLMSVGTDPDDSGEDDGEDSETIMIDDLFEEEK